MYDPGRADIDRIAKRALVEFYDENALDPTVFPSLLRIENDVIGMARDHLRGGPDVVGNFTTGGTESIMMAVKAARDRARQLRPELTNPTMVLPVTAHAAFHKAAHYFDVEPISVPVDTTTWKADVDAMRDAVDDRTDPAGRLSGVLRPRRGRPDPRAGPAGARARPAAARRRLHRRVHPARTSDGWAARSPTSTSPCRA